MYETWMGASDMDMVGWYYDRIPNMALRYDGWVSAIGFRGFAGSKASRPLLFSLVAISEIGRKQFRRTAVDGFPGKINISTRMFG